MRNEAPSSAFDVLFHDPSTLTRAELEGHAQALWAVLRIADAVHSARDLNELGEVAVDAVTRYTNFPSVALFRLDEREGHLHLVAARGFSEEVLARARRLPVVGSLTGLAVTRRTLVTSYDLRHDSRVEPATRVALQQDGFVEVASIPLFERDRVIGTLNLIYRQRSQLSDSERRILMAIGQTIGLAISHRAAAAEQQKLEEQARRAQQVESLGVLAGGIAHDFNNILTGILGNVSLARALIDSQQQAELDELMVEAEQACDRAVGLVRQLLTFARGGAPLRRPTRDLATLVEEAARFAARGTSIQLEFEAEPELGTVEIDPGQIMQVVQNLVLNAVQASRSGATVRVSLSRVEAEDGAQRPRVRLVVEDQGSGIAEADLPRIFEPYFTTRAGGNGLGLATTYSIVRRHDGHIHAESQLGVGSRFIVELCVAGEEAAPSRRSDALLSLPPAGLRVLVLDDDTSVRTMLARMVADVGGAAVAASRGEEAISLFAQARAMNQPFDVVILDLTIVGGLGGKDTLQRLLDIDGSVRAIASSGYASDPILANPGQYGFVGVLPKPYTRQALRNALRQALGR
jgi:signal transduction histidine kinase/ActR/RegA family two-component response regulator